MKTPLSFTFENKVGLRIPKEKTIRLYRTNDPATPIRTADLETGDAGDGTNTVAFDNLPILEPDTAYFLLADRGWISCGGKPLPALNDGAYWFRFRTVAK